MEPARRSGIAAAPWKKGWSGRRDIGGRGHDLYAWGFSSHPHWDHLLWHSRFGDLPRFATPPAPLTSEAGERAQTMAAESACGIPLELIGLFTLLPADGGPVPGEIVEHQEHPIGHAAVLLADRGVLLAATCSPTS